jgi:phosphoglycolate phosphatase
MSSAEQGITTVLFDLDGTLSDSAPGIIASMRAAFHEHNVDWMSDSVATSLLGPPLSESLKPYVGEENVPMMVATYRRHYIDRGGMFNATVYNGIDELVRELHRRGIRMAVATSKAEPPAVSVLEHLELSTWFTTIGGDTLEGTRPTKALVIKDVLWRLGSPDPSTVLMVGDRSHDVHGALEHEIRCVGALWGYGDPDELETAGAWKTCVHPSEILSLLHR